MQEFCVHYAGFEVFRPITVGDDILQDSVRQGLSSALSTLIPRMVGDADIQLEGAWGSKSGRVSCSVLMTVLLTASRVAGRSTQRLHRRHCPAHACIGPIRFGP
jgi:hypothetical protein